MLALSHISSPYMLFIGILTARFVDVAGQLGKELSSLHFLLFFNHSFLLFFLFLLNCGSRLLSQGVSFEFSQGGVFTDLKRLKPRHVEALLQAGALVAVLVKESGAKVDGLLADVQPGFEVEFRGILDCLTSDFFVIFVVEGQYATEHEVGDNTERPEIYLLTVGLLQ